MIFALNFIVWTQFVSRPITHPANIYVTVKVIFDIQIKLRINFYLVHLTSRGLFHAKFSDETHIRTRKHPRLPLMDNILFHAASEGYIYSTIRNTIQIILKTQCINSPFANS